MVDLNQVDESHRATWHSAVSVGRKTIIIVVLVLALMAIFLT